MVLSCWTVDPSRIKSEYNFSINEFNLCIFPKNSYDRPHVFTALHSYSIYIDSHSCVVLANATCFSSYLSTRTRSPCHPTL